MEIQAFASALGALIHSVALARPLPAAGVEAIRKAVAVAKSATGLRMGAPSMNAIHVETGTPLARKRRATATLPHSHTGISTPIASAGARPRIGLRLPTLPRLLV